MHATAIVQTTHSQATLAQLADVFVTGLRRRMFVPDGADDDVEAEFIAFRSHLDTRYYPEFCELFVDALSAELQKLKNSGQNPMARLHGLMGSQPREASSRQDEPNARLRARSASARLSDRVNATAVEHAVQQRARARACALVTLTRVQPGVRSGSQVRRMRGQNPVCGCGRTVGDP